jgi:hypothetical protein
LRGRSRPPMCYTRKDWSREEEARRQHAEERTRVPRREAEIRSDRHEHKEEKPLTEKVKEVVGLR